MTVLAILKDLSKNQQIKLMSCPKCHCVDFNQSFELSYVPSFVFQKCFLEEMSKDPARKRAAKMDPG